MTNNELISIKGGALSGNVVNALVKAINSAFELGKAIGSAIRRKITGTKCPL